MMLMNYSLVPMIVFCSFIYICFFVICHVKYLTSSTITTAIRHSITAGMTFSYLPDTFMCAEKHLIILRTHTTLYWFNCGHYTPTKTASCQENGGSPNGFFKTIWIWKSQEKLSSYRQSIITMLLISVK